MVQVIFTLKENIVVTVDFSEKVYSSFIEKIDAVLSGKFVDLSQGDTINLIATDQIVTIRRVVV